MSIQIRNIAIIAHVDHGKTTMVDQLLRSSGTFAAHEKVVDTVMDNHAIERERGITILAKNCAVRWKDTHINILDTPGHADFGGEVERALSMVDGVVLLIDSQEGPMPQTRFVLQKALEIGLKPIVVINKIDRPDQRVKEVEDEVLELFMELDADDDQLDFPVVYASARDGIAKLSMDEEGTNMDPLFQVLIKEIPAPNGDVDGPLQFMVTTLDYDDYVGKIAVGRIVRGRMKAGQQVAIMNGESTRKAKIGRLYTYNGLNRVETDEAMMGDIIAFVGIEDINIGETVADVENPEALPSITIDEPTLSMVFSVNNSPFAGREGEFVTSRHLRDRLFKEVQTNVSMKVEETESPDAFKVSGRGELHLAVLIETMRREGYELQVGKPRVIYKRINDQLCEPLEHLTIDVPQEFMGTVMENLGARKADLINMTELAGYLRMEFVIPARGLIGFRAQFLTATKGNGIMNHVFHGYAPFKGDIPGRTRGALVAFEDGETTPYGLNSVQDRGTLFVGPNEPVYTGRIIGENTREMDMDVNPCKKKHVTNMRSSSSDEAVRLTPPRIFSLEQALEWINDDELVEVTPKSIRMRKTILDRAARAKAAKSGR